MLDTSSEARLVLDRVGRDLAGMFIRKDMDYVFENPTVSADDIMRFYTEVYTETPQTNSGIQQQTMVRLSLVGYRVDEDGTGGKLALYRGAKGYSYLDNGFMGLDFATVTSGSGPATEVINVIAIDTLSSPDYDLLSPNVFRMEIAVIDGQGDLKSSIPKDSLHGGNDSADIEDAKYLVVAIAILSPEDRARLEPRNIDDMADELGRVADDETPFEAWAEYIDGTRTFTGIPPSIANNVRYFQRAYPLSDR